MDTDANIDKELENMLEILKLIRKDKLCASIYNTTVATLLEKNKDGQLLQDKVCCLVGFCFIDLYKNGRLILKED